MARGGVAVVEVAAGLAGRARRPEARPDHHPRRRPEGPQPARLRRGRRRRRPARHPRPPTWARSSSSKARTGSRPRPARRPASRGSTRPTTVPPDTPPRPERPAHDHRRTPRRLPRLLRLQGLRPPAQRRARAQRPDRAVHAGRDEPVQARVHGPGRPELHARHDLPEVHPHRRHRERRQDRRST